jgi:hypothetical protein
MSVATGTPATTTVTPDVATTTPAAVDTVMAAEMDAAQMAVATVVVTGAKVPTTTAAVNPAAADIGNSLEFVQPRTSTADSIRCQPFSTPGLMRSLLCAGG